MKLWIVDDGGRFEECLAVVRAATLEEAREVFRRWREENYEMSPAREQPAVGNRELEPDGAPAVVWAHERSWDPRE